MRNFERIRRRNMMARMRLILVAVVMTVGCTPGMHKAYQITMASLATAAWACDASQTTSALASGMAIEANPINGEHPSSVRIWASTAASSALVWSMLAVPSNRLGDETSGSYVKDVLVTLPAVLEGFVVANNAKLLDRPALRCGR